MRIDNEVLAVLSNAETNGYELTLTGQLDRKLYERTNKVLEAAGGKWNRKAKAHVFEYEAADRIDEIMLSGEIEIPKDEYNYFPTPPNIAKKLVELAEIEEGMLVLEPSAGRGALAHACSAAGAVVDWFELMEKNYLELSKDWLVGYGIHGDFLTQTPESKYDRVVMNPPFAKQADIRHVTHALKFLKPTGKLVSIMSAGITFRGNKLTKDFLALVVQRGGKIESLPDGAFKESGTMVKTVIVEIPA